MSRKIVQVQEEEKEKEPLFILLLILLFLLHLHYPPRSCSRLAIRTLRAWRLSDSRIMSRKIVQVQEEEKEKEPLFILLLILLFLVHLHYPPRSCSRLATGTLLAWRGDHLT